MPPKGFKNTASHDTTHCSWTDADDAIVVRVLKEQKEGGNQSGAGWVSIADSFERRLWTISVHSRTIIASKRQGNDGERGESVELKAI